MRKFFLISVALALVFSLCSCFGNEKNSPDSGENGSNDSSNEPPSHDDGLDDEKFTDDEIHGEGDIGSSDSDLSDDTVDLLIDEFQ